MFGNGDVPVFGGSLTFSAGLPDGRRFRIVILPDEQHEGSSAAPGFVRHQGLPITPAVVWEYLPDYARIAWRQGQPTFFGRTEERRTEFPGLEVRPLKFAAGELQASHWRFLMGAVGNQAAYIRLGFRDTGARAPYPLPPGGQEMVMERPL